MQAMKPPLKFGFTPTRLRLPRSQVLTCIAGCLWMTSDVLAGSRDSVVVLQSGQFFVTPQAASYFVGAPRGSGVLSFLPPDTLIPDSKAALC